MDIDVLIEDLMARAKEYGYVLTSQYTINEQGEICEIKLKVVGQTP